MLEPKNDRSCCPCSFRQLQLKSHARAYALFRGHADARAQACHERACVHGSDLLKGEVPGYRASFPHSRPPQSYGLRP